MESETKMETIVSMSEEAAVGVSCHIIGDKPEPMVVDVDVELDNDSKELKFEKLENENGGDDDGGMIFKQTSTNISDFSKPSSIYLRNNVIDSNQEDFTHADGLNSSNGPVQLEGWIENVMDNLSEPVLIKKDGVAVADICPLRNRPRLVVNKSQIKEHYGYDIQGTTYLWPEEVLFLLENGRLEFFIAEVAVSVERARALLLHSKLSTHLNSEKLPTCESDEYTVFKYFTKLGYRVRRREGQPFVTTPDVSDIAAAKDTVMDSSDKLQGDDDSSKDQQMMDDVMMADLEGKDSLCGSSEALDNAKRGMKRKAPISSSSSDENEDSDSVRTLSDDYVLFVSDEYGSLYENTLADEDTDIEGSYTNYSVIEADSDVEIVDEVIISHGSVGIEEIESVSQDEFDELVAGISSGSPQPGPSSAARVIVDLVSSDSESDLEDITNENIWCDFSSVDVFEMKFPRAHLLRSNLSFRCDSKSYTYQKNHFAQSSHTPSQTTDENIADPKEIEKFVDELKLDSCTEKPNGGGHAIFNDLEAEERRINCGSWKEWRQLIMADARDALNESLLGNENGIPSNNGPTDVAQKLNRWANVQQTNQKEGLKLYIPFDLFPILNRAVSKKQLWSSIQPIYHIAVARTLDSVPSSYDMTTQFKTGDNVPLIFAIVNDEAEVLVFSSNLKPLPSLF